MSYTGAAMRRYAEIDWLRGLMLVLMTVTHLPTWFSNALGQPFGYVSAAEGFVFVSAFLVGCVYGRVARERGYGAMRAVVWRRAGKIYLAHIAILLFLLWVLVPVAVAKDAHAITDLASFYLAHPGEALAGGLLLVYNPPLLDILPMYVVFMAFSPALMEHGLRRGWGRVLAASGLVWLLAQADVGQALYDAVARATDLGIPYRQTGAFSWMAWQLMWVLGVCAGTQASTVAPRRTPMPRAVIVGAAAVALVFFVWRHVDGQVPVGSPLLAVAMDKWHLGPLRLLDFGALAILVICAREAIAARAHASPLVTLGKASLTVFCAHLLICLGALAVVGAPGTPLHWHDSALLAGTLAILYAVALTSLAGRRLVPPALRLSVRRPAPRTAR
jgi:hypothetical protein